MKFFIKLVEPGRDDPEFGAGLGNPALQPGMMGNGQSIHTRFPHGQIERVLTNHAHGRWNHPKRLAAIVRVGQEDVRLNQVVRSCPVFLGNPASIQTRFPPWRLPAVSYMASRSPTKASMKSNASRFWNTR